MVLQIIAAAEVELREAVAWYRERDVRVAARFAQETRKVLKLIDEFPQIGGRVPEITDPHVRRMPIHTFPYHVIFVRLDARTEVVAFAHNRKQPAYFIRRLNRT
ncbi:MAG: type II toxin-antitoxin system RelE/ParE family toxin [Acidobacteriota bacterium]|nr:type II toxin-antitoxin system RelE/ParE family toxin [Acidobacteriota bacterium]